MQYMSREEAILFQKEEVERIQAEQKATEAKTLAAKQAADELRRAAESADTQHQQRQRDLQAAQEEQDRLAAEKAEQAKAEQDRVVQHQERIESLKETPRDPNLGDFDAQTFYAAQQEVERRLLEKYPWLRPGFYKPESQDGTSWAPGKASDFDLLNPKKQIEEINLEAKRRHEAEEKERAIKLAEQKAQQETLIKEVTDALAEKLNSLSGLDTIAFSNMQKEIERRLAEKYNSISSK